jgi:hypothetical protein
MSRNVLRGTHVQGRIFSLLFLGLSGYSEWLCDQDYILAEIRRKAQENGGQPPGRMPFSKETGIKKSDWLGRFWTKWSDAVAEAGFSPNTFGRSYASEELFGPPIRFVLEIGKLPTGAELAMKARRTPNFPSHGTYQRYGRRGLAEALLRYCEENDGPAEVITICEKVIIVSPDEGSGADVEPQGEVDYGDLYLVKSGRYFKLGRSNHFGRRSYELEIQLPEEAKLIHKIRTDDPIGIEEYWHKRFKDKRKKEEWFDLTTEDVNAFKRRNSCK